jgi:hypothetical protein
MMRSRRGRRDTDILMLTGSSRASEVANEKGSMADIHPSSPETDVVEELRQAFWISWGSERIIDGPC